MQYFVKDLGLFSKTDHMAAARAMIQSLNRSIAWQYLLLDENLLSQCVISPGEVVMEKYMCAVCEIVGATWFCSNCKVPRYCSGECQRIHWKFGGHKRECVEREWSSLGPTRNCAASSQKMHWKFAAHGQECVERKRRWHCFTERHQSLLICW